MGDVKLGSGMFDEREDTTYDAWQGFQTLHNIPRTMLHSKK